MVKAIKDFKYSPDGFNIIEIKAGQEIPTGRAMEVARSLGAMPKKAMAPKKNKALTPARNK